ncbi:VMA21-like domain-containing protein [Ditylenchus destructor]|nr:VMA21-like domain-containing protein [Ditylenchus destructor]
MDDERVTDRSRTASSASEIDAAELAELSQHTESEEDENEVNELTDAVYEEAQSSATCKLIVFSFFMFTVPLAVMYLAYVYIFIEHYHLPKDRAALYAGLLGIAVVYVIVALFIWIAYKDEKKFAQSMDEVNESKKLI